MPNPVVAIQYLKEIYVGPNPNNSLDSHWSHVNCDPDEATHVVPITSPSTDVTDYDPDYDLIN